MSVRQQVAIGAKHAEEVHRLRGFAMLLCFQLAGDSLARLAQLPISGPICGMVALLVFLFWKGADDSDLNKVCDGILANMPLLFVPVGVGAISYAAVFSRDWSIIACAIVIGTVAGMLTTVFFTRTAAALMVRRSRLPKGQMKIEVASDPSIERARTTDKAIARLL